MDTSKPPFLVFVLLYFPLIAGYENLKTPRLLPFMLQYVDKWELQALCDIGSLCIFDDNTINISTKKNHERHYL
jgi:hypothetical protein